MNNLNSSVPSIIKNESDNDPMLLEKTTGRSKVSGKRKEVDNAEAQDKQKRLKVDDAALTVFKKEILNEREEDIQGVNYFSDLPEELRQEIFRRVEPYSLIFCRMISKQSFLDTSGYEFLRKIDLVLAKKLRLKAEVFNDQDEMGTYLIIKAQIEALSLEEAEINLQKIKTPESIARLTLGIAKAKFRIGNMPGAEILFKSAIDVFTTSNMLYERDSAYVEFGEELLRLGDVEGAKSLMKSINHASSLRSLNQAILKKEIELGNIPRLNIPELLEDYNYHEFIVLYFKALISRDLIEESKGVVVNVLDCSALVHTKEKFFVQIAKALDINKHEDILRLILKQLDSLITQDNNISVKDPSKFELLVAINRQKIKQGEMNGSSDTFKLVKNEFNRIATTKYIDKVLKKQATLLAEIGNVADSLLTVKRIDREEIKFFTYIKIAKIAIKNRNVTDAPQILNLAHKTALRIKDVGTISTLIRDVKNAQVECSTNEFNSTLEMFKNYLRELKEKSDKKTNDLYRIKSYREIGTAQFHCGDAIGSAETFNLAINLFKTLKPQKNKSENVRRNQGISTEMAIELFKSNLKEEALEVVKMIDQARIKVKVLMQMHTIHLQQRMGL